MGKNQILVIPQGSGGGGGSVNSVNAGAGIQVTGTTDPVVSLKIDVISANKTAVNNETYNVTGTSVFTDPTPVAGKGYTVNVLEGGSATVGGTVYAVAGTVVRRVYDGGTWSNYTNLSTLGEVGLIRNETFANLTDWTVSAGAWTVGGSGLNIPAGSNDFTSAMLLSKYNGTNKGTKYEKVTFKGAGLVIPTITGTTYGVAFGLRSISNPSVLNSIHVRFCMDTVLAGYIQVYHNSSVATVYAQSVAPMPISAGDSTSFDIRRDGNVLYVTWTNNTQNNISVSLQYNIGLNTSIVPPNYSVPAFWGNGAATTLSTWSWTCNELKNPDVLYIVDSIGTGMLSDNGLQRYPDILKLLTSQNIVVLSGAGDRIEDNNPNEAVAINPSNIVIFCLSNNAGTLQSTATMLTNLATYISGLTGYTYNSNLFISKIMPRNDVDVASYNTALIGAYGVSGLIDPYYTFKNPSGTGINSTLSKDGIHPTPNACYSLAMVNLTFGLNKGFFTRPNKPQPYRNTPYYQGTKLRIGSTGTPFATLDIANDDAIAQLRVGNTNLDNGGYFFNNGSTWLSDNIGFNGTNYISKATTVSGIYQGLGIIHFMGGSGLTIGAGLNATGIDRFTIASSGLSTFLPNGQGVSIVEANNTTTRGLLIAQYSNGVDPAQFIFQKSRNTSTSGGNTTVVNGDVIGRILFKGADGTNKISSSYIQAVVNGTVSTGVVPQDIVAYTGSSNTPTERFRITSLGTVLIGTASLANSATDGFAGIPSIASAPSGVPTASTGFSQMCVEPTADKLWVYVNGSWKSTTLV